jgi:hypothetical protein
MVANTQSQYGFRHIGFLPGYAPDYQMLHVAIQSSYATKIFNGDPVVKSASSQYIQVATGTGNLTSVLGIFQGCWYVPSGGGAPVYSPWWPASQQSDATAYVMASPGATFQVAALLTAVPATAVGQNIGWSTGAGGTTVGGGFSTYTVDQATLTTGNSAPFQVVELFQGIGNGSDPTTNYNWVTVTFNNQRFRAGQTGIA